MEYTVTSVTRRRFKADRARRQRILREYRARIRTELRWVSALAIETQVRAKYDIPTQTWEIWMTNIADGVWTWDGVRSAPGKSQPCSR